MNIKKLYICLILSLTVCFIGGCGGSGQPQKIEDEIVRYLDELADKYGEIGYDAQYVYCDGEYQYFVIYYYGTGANTKVPDTTAVYRVDNNNNSEMYLDFMEEKKDINSQLDQVLLATCIDKYNEFKSNGQEITYEEFKNFEKGYMKVDFDILHDLTQKRL